MLPTCQKYEKVILIQAREIIYVLTVSGYDCGMYVISIAEHLCKELCEGYSIDLNEIITSDYVRKKRSQVKELIEKVAHEFGS